MELTASNPKAISPFAERKLRSRFLGGLTLGSLLLAVPAQAQSDVAFWSAAPGPTVREVASCCGLQSAQVDFGADFRCNVRSTTASCLHSAVHATNGRMSAAFREITQITSPETATVIQRLCREAAGSKFLSMEAACTRRLLEQENPELLGALRASRIPPAAYRIRLDRWSSSLTQRSLIVLACRRAVGGVTVEQSVVEGRTRVLTRQTGTPDPECLSEPRLRSASFDNSDFTRPRTETPSLTPPARVAATEESEPSRPPSIGFPSLRASEASEPRFDSCMLGYTLGIEESRRNQTAEQVCHAIRGSSLAPFDAEIARLMARSNLQTYFELLRMEALSRFMAAQQHWVGVPVNQLPAACDPFAAGLSDLQRASTALSSTQTPEFAQALHQQARFVLRLREEAIRFASVPSRECSGDLGPGGHAICTPNPDYERAQAELSRIRANLHEAIGAFPVLASGRSLSDREPWQELQAASGFAEATPGSEEFHSHLARARSAIAADVRVSLERFCGDRPPDGITGNELVQIPDLTSAVTQRFPQFNAVQICLQERAERTETLRHGAQLMATGGCILGTIATEGALAPVCGALGIGIGYQGYASARERLYWTERCNAAGGTVCSDAMYAEARAAYDSAVLVLGASVVGAAIDLPILANQLRGAARFLSASRMRTVATEIRDASALGDEAARAAALRRVAAQVTDETAPTASRAALRQRLSERLGESTARGRFPCLFR